MHPFERLVSLHISKRNVAKSPFRVLLDSDTAASRLALSKRALYMLVSNGHITVAKRIRRRLWFSEAEVERTAKERGLGVEASAKSATEC